MKMDDVKGKIKAAFSRTRKPVPAQLGDPALASEMPSSNGIRTDAVPKSMDAPESQFLDEGVIVLGKRKYAVNLNWRPHTDQPMRFQAEQAKAGINLFLTYEFFVDLKDRGQIGFAAREIGHVDRMKVLATSIPESLTGARWIGAFRIGLSGEHWWLVSMRDGVVYEDTVIHGTVDAIAALQNELTAPDWTRIFAPDEWDIMDATEAAIGDVVVQKGMADLRPVIPLRTYAPRIVVAGLIIVGSVVGYVIYDRIQKDAAEALAQIARQQQRVISVYKSDFPWYERTEVEVFTTACRDEIGKSVFLIPGWEAQPVSCRIARGEGVVTAGWTRTNDGRISWLRAAMPETYPLTELSPDGRSASLVRTFDVSFVDGEGSADHWAPDLITSTLRERFQTLGLELGMSQRSQRTTARGPQDNSIFNYHEISVSTNFAMEEHARLFADVPAFVVDALILNIASGTWTISAKAYHEPILPLGAELR